MNKLTFTKFIFYLTIASVGLVGVMCGQSTEKRPATTVKFEGLHMIIRTADSIVFHWSVPPSGADSVKFYQLFYKANYPDSAWRVCKDSIPPSKTPTTTVYRSNIKSSAREFLFSVRYIMMNGDISETHYSSDATAIVGGWFIKWE
jgi:hypothetical protein